MTEGEQAALAAIIQAFWAGLSPDSSPICPKPLKRKKRNGRSKT